LDNIFESIEHIDRGCINNSYIRNVRMLLLLIKNNKPTAVTIYLKLSQEEFTSYDKMIMAKGFEEYCTRNKILYTDISKILLKITVDK